MSIASEITRLQNAKVDIKIAIEAKGVEVPSNATLDEYSDYVEEISTGIMPTGTINITENGTSDVTNYASASVNVQPDLETKSITITENTTTTITPTQGKDGLSSVEVTTNVSTSVESISDINSTISGFKSKLVEIPTNYETYVNNPVTLYTPNLNYPIYFIFKNNNNSYRIGWGNSYNDYCGIIKTSRLAIKSCNFILSGTAYFSGINNRYYSTNTYSTIEECIQAIQNNTTSYSSGNNDTYFNLKDKNSLYATNRYYVDDEPYNFLTTKRISQNETIEVIPTT